MQNAVIYARFSSHGQNEQSIDGQIEECQQYCDQMGFNIVGVYHDNAIIWYKQTGRVQVVNGIGLKMLPPLTIFVLWATTAVRATVGLPTVSVFALAF